MLNLLKYFCYIYTALTFIPFAVLFAGIVIAAWENRKIEPKVKWPFD